MPLTPFLKPKLSRSALEVMKPATPALNTEPLRFGATPRLRLYAPEWRSRAVALLCYALSVVGAWALLVWSLRQ